MEIWDCMRIGEEVEDGNKWFKREMLENHLKLIQEEIGKMRAAIKYQSKYEELDDIARDIRAFSASLVDMVERSFSDEHYYGEIK